MKYVIALLATLVALPALAHGPKMTVDADPGSGITNIGDRYSVMLDFDLIAELGSASVADLSDVGIVGTQYNGDVLTWNTTSGPAQWKNAPRQFYQKTSPDPLLSINWGETGFAFGGSPGSGCLLQNFCWSVENEAHFVNGVLQPNTVLAPIALSDGAGAPTNSVGTVFTTQNTSAALLASFPNMPHGAEWTVIFKDAVTSVDFSSSSIVGNGGVDWGPAAVDEVMTCTKNDALSYCQVPSSVDGGSADSGTLPFTLGDNDEFVFDAGGNLTLGVAGAGINVSPPTATGGQLVLPSSLNSGGSAFTLKVHDLGLTNPVNCTINTDGQLDAGCPLIPAGSGGGGGISEDYAVAAKRAVVEHWGFPQALASQISTNWQPILDPSVAIFISGDIDPDVNDLDDNTWSHYVYFETVLNGDPTNIQADPTLTGPADCLGARLNAYTCADAIQILNPGTYEITVTMIADRNNIMVTQRTDPTQTNVDANTCAPWWYVDNNDRMFAKGSGGQVEPSINAKRSLGTDCNDPLENGVTVCDTLNVWENSARADVNVTTTARGFSAYVVNNFLVGDSAHLRVYDNAEDDVAGGYPYYNTISTLSACSWNKAMGVIIVEVRKTS